MVNLFGRWWSQDVERPKPQPSNSTGAAAFAWQVHQAQEAWTSKVDTKGSILLALEGGALFAALSASGKDGALARLDGWRQAVEIGGISALILAMVAAGLAVFPMLGSVRRQYAQHRTHVVYFGHLRHWEPADLQRRLRDLRPEDQFESLADQLVRAGRMNWAKYRLVQFSLVLALVGVLAVSTAAFFP
ncbi:hypothetical protein GCM10010464_80090 [Pseudonocardia yunnanensis]|uniref:Pycsar system effector family protein n=1 Tax=Pseudonocardia yunnanensis TaxID=58107 RepID=A0ABW4ERJ6_9PSEU